MDGTFTEMGESCEEVGVSLQEFHCAPGDFEMSVHYTNGDGH